MGFNCGIVGLPNVGKSTIFNALTAAGAEAANYPFCTIEPNTGVVAVPDARLLTLAGIASSAQVKPTSIEFVDIAGLVKGASEGEGLGNQFLGHIRSVDAIAHVVRCFDDENITHVHGSVSPKRDIEVIETELLLADLSSVEKRIDKVARTAKTGDKAAKEQLALLEFAREHLGQGTLLNRVGQQMPGIETLGLITSKPMFYVANVPEAEVRAGVAPSPYLQEVFEVAAANNCTVAVISGEVEAQIASLEPEERTQFLEELGLEQSGLERLALEGYKVLDLITFFTVGPREACAWTCRQGTVAVDAAGLIHSDISRGFIRAEVISCNHYIEAKGEQGAKEKGLMRLEGKAYVMQDGDVVYFRFNV